MCCKRDSAPGLDGMSYAIIRKLPQTTFDFLLELFYRFFLSSEFTTDWRNTAHFRPIHLTSTLCKLFERIIHKRLEHFVERGNFIPKFQFGCRKGRSSTDCVATLTTDISQHFVAREHTVAHALDLKGAFNNVLPADILRTLIDIGASSWLVNFVSFLTESRNLFFGGGNSDPRT